MSADRLDSVRVRETRCASCIFGPRSPIDGHRRREHYEPIWRGGDTFQICHEASLAGDHALVCRGFYDWCDAVGWQPTILQLAERLEALELVPGPAA